MTSGGQFTRWLILLTALMILASPVLAVKADMYIFAVSQDGKGIPARLTVDVTPGTGQINLTLNSIVGEDTQRSITNAIKAAVAEANDDFYAHNYTITIDSGAEYVSGPSAGLPIALAVYAALKGKDVPDTISATGTIDEDGYVGPVGGIYPKAKAAHEVGVKIFLIPKGERYVDVPEGEEVEPGVIVPSTKKVDIVALAKKEWNMDIYEAETLHQAILIAFKGERPEVNLPEENPPTEVNFIPPAVAPRYSDAFKPLVESLIEELNAELEKNCIHTPPYYDEYKRSASSYLNRAKLVLSRGYYYTAGNYAFLGLTLISAVNELCEHPSMADPQSLAFQTYLEDLKSKVEALKMRADRLPLTTENYEWLGGARERIIRAETTLSSITFTDPVIVLRRLKSVEYWLKSADEMLSIAEEKNEGTVLKGVDEVARSEIIAVEDLVYQSDRDVPSAKERLAWAKEAYNRGWYYAAFAEAALAKGLYLGDVIPSDQLPSAVEKYQAETNTVVGMWAELYRNHGLYYKEAADAYRRVGEKIKAEDMMRTALEMLVASQDFSRFSEGVQPLKTSVKVEKVQTNAPILAAIGAFFLVLAVLLLINALHERKKVSLKGLDPEKRKKAEELVQRAMILAEVKKYVKRRHESHPSEDTEKLIEYIDRRLKKIEKELEKILEPEPQRSSSRPSRGKHQLSDWPPSRRRRGARRR